MSLANCLNSDKYKGQFTAAQEKEMASLADKLFIGGKGKIERIAAERAAVQQMLDDALKQQAEVVALVRDAMGLPEEEPVEAKRPEAKAEQAKPEDTALLTNGTQYVRTLADNATPDTGLLGGEWAKHDAAPEAAQDKAPIADMGQKIGGARKDVWTSYKDKLDEAGEVDIKAEPLSKSWPAPDYEAMLEAGAEPWAVAFMHAARDEVPTKPSSTWKLSRWVDQVKTLREFAMGLADGSMSVEKTRLEIAKTQALSDIASRVELYMAVGHSKSLRGVRMTAHSYSLYKGTEYKPAKVLWAVEQKAKATAFSNWPRELAIGDTKEEALAKFKEQFAALDIDKPASKETKFEIYSTRGENGYRIGKKMGRNPILLTEGFATVKEAREYMRTHQDELVKKLEDAKKIPSVRRDTNEPRVGEDMRGGQDVTPEMFMDAFGFKGVEFGNWVEQKKRQKDLNDAYDALMDMAAVIGVKPKALSLNGELGLAFGARGTGGVDPAAAHYESNFVVINLTKKEGAGSLGHEWWHALDNYFSRMRGKKGDYTTEALDVSLASRSSEFVANTAVRKEMIAAFGEVMKAINLTRMKARSSKLDSKRSKEYWTTGLEMSARAYESYLISKLQDQDASNDYLANIVGENTWAAAEKLGFELEESYPYPTAGEVPAIRAAFDHFFQTVETKETDTGTAMFSRTTPQFYSPLARAFDNAKQESMPAGMWKAWLNSNAAKLGLKKDEITWSGIEEYLDLQGKAKVSKAEITDYLSESGVKVEDVVLGDKNTEIKFSEVEYDGEDFTQAFEAEYFTAEEGYRRKVGIYYSADADGWWAYSDGQALVEDTDRATAEQAAREAALEGVAPSDDAIAPTKFAKYAPPGGIPGTYRETLVTLPTENTRLRNEGDRIGRLENPTPEEIETFRRANKAGMDKGSVFTSSHFDQPNILTHIRSDEVTGADGKRYLRVIEIQSDFGQSFKKQKDAIKKSVDSDFQGIVGRMEEAGVLEINCD